MNRIPGVPGVPQSSAALFVILGLLLFAPMASGQWYNSSWTKRKAITVNSGQVPSTQSNFPMLVSLASDSDLAGNALANGYDILFTDSSGTNKLSYQRELYNSSTGQLIAWVNVPSLANGTVIYMYFGNSSETTDQQNATGAWNSNYGMVLHLANGSASPAPDSTANGNNAANNGLTAITGKIGGAATSPGGQTEGLYIASPTTSIQTTGPLTYSMWVNPNALENPQGEEQYLINGAAAFWLNTNGTLQGWLGTSGSYVNAQSTNTLATGAWSYVVFTFDGVVGDLPHIYVNGSEVSYNTQGGGSGSLGSFSGPMAIGEAASNVYAYNLKGGLEEARIATTNLSANWIQTEYNNQSAPSTFFTEGSVQNYGGSQVATPTFSPAAGTYGSTQTATISTSTSGATIRYTTDGSTPSETHGTVYSSAVSVGSTTTINAIAYESGMADSAVASATFTITSSGNTAVFVTLDTTTQGTWQGVYGTSGYNVIDDAMSYPSDVTVTPTGASTYQWANPTSAVQALQLVGNPGSRIAATWYGGTFSIAVNFSDTAQHQLALYCLDWDGSNGRAETISVTNGTTGAVLDSRSVSSFSSGEYVVWNVTGNVVITV